jgi:exonuclease SbcC
VIPQRVRLRGFLSYKDEQEVAFDGASLWMLSGLNGSGKSTVFDAVTYALFGHHRGGGQHAHELINKDSDTLAVEFDFTLDGVLYRAKRTLRRDARGGAKGTQQVFRYGGGPGGNGKGSWVAVEGTGQKREFDAWVADNIGLTYETFTSSVLLLQGKAEKLLDSKPEGRREVLASIVDLERYERLHKLADDKRKERDVALKALNQRLAALPPVSGEELAAAKDAIAAAEAKLAAAAAEVERLRVVEYQSREWVKLQGRLAEARRRWEEAAALLGNAADIERDVDRLRDLRDVLPRLKDIHTQRSNAHQAMLRLAELTRHRQDLAGDLTRWESALQQARDKRGSLQKLIAADEARQREVVAELRELTAAVEKLKEYERQEADLARVRSELAALPGDPAQAVARARAACETLAALAPVVPALERFRARRDALRRAARDETAAAQAEQAVLARGKQFAAAADALKARREEAGRVLQEVADRAAAARTVLRQARESLQELTQLDGAKVCRHCGQALTPAHLGEEKRRRAAAACAAEADAKQADAAHQAARAAEADLREHYERAEKERHDARVEYGEAKGRAAQARADVARLREECGPAYGELPARFRTRVGAAPPADWAETTYPDEAEVAAVRAEAGGLAVARRDLQQAEKTQEQWAKLHARESAALRILDRIRDELPPDRAALRSEHAGLAAEDLSLQKNLEAQRAKLKEAEGDFDRLTKDRDRVQGQQVTLDGELKKQEVQRDHAQQTAAKLLKTLPPAWRDEAEKAGLAQLGTWEGELKALESARTDDRGHELAKARVNLDALQRDREALELSQEGYPEEARQDPDAVAERLAGARESGRACDEELGRARQGLAQLESYRRQRAHLEKETREAEGELTADKLLAELLGRERLQLYLVRQAERQVVEHANAVLDRLSGGKLYLKLVGEANGEGSSAKALELEAYNRATGEKPINVAFLSGSQKFRVAVSLALGIGQYASRQHRPIEAVIIDEGFGCLDHQGRQVMIQELQNLRSQMRCILLVSHQEEFAEAFADGYHFRLDEGATRVTRVQK